MNSANSFTLFLAALPKLPLILWTVAGHALNLSRNSFKWDLRTELIVRVIRAYLDPSNKPRKLSDSQTASLKDPGVTGHKWISRYTIPKPKEDDIRQLLLTAIEDLKEGGEVYIEPELLSVE